MKTKICLLLIFVGISFSISAQKKIITPENKYRINLPDYWGKGNKVWKILIDKLPVICEELKDKELCGDDCKPKYTVELYINEPFIEEYRYSKIFPLVKTNTRSINYPLRVGADGRILLPQSALEYQNQIDNSDNKWRFKSLYSFQCFLLLMENNEKIVTKMVLVDTNEIWEKDFAYDLSGKINTNPDTFIDNYKEELIPNLNDLFIIIDKKLLELK